MLLSLRTYILIVFVLSQGCGTNIYQQFDSQDPAESAAIALDEENPDKAIKILESALESEPMNSTFLSLMASAKAQKAGIDTITFALTMATAGGTGGILGLLDVVPAYSSEAILLLEDAISYQERIPVSERLPADLFKMSMFFSALMTLRTKNLDSDGDGNFTLEELLALDAATAELIIGDLASAESILSGFTAEDGTQDAADNVGEIRSTIDSQDGDSDLDKLKNLLANG